MCFSSYSRQIRSLQQQKSHIFSPHFPFVSGSMCFFLLYMSHLVAVGITKTEIYFRRLQSRVELITRGTKIDFVAICADSGLFHSNDETTILPSNVAYWHDDKNRDIAIASHRDSQLKSDRKTTLEWLRLCGIWALQLQNKVSCVISLASLR